MQGTVRTNGIGGLICNIGMHQYVFDVAVLTVYREGDRAVGRGGGGAMSAFIPLACRKAQLSLRGRVKMTLRMQEKWTSTT